MLESTIYNQIDITVDNIMILTSTASWRLVSRCWIHSPRWYT